MATSVRFVAVSLSVASLACQDIQLLNKLHPLISLPFITKGAIVYTGDSHRLVCGSSPDKKGKLLLVKEDPATASLEVVKSEDFGAIVPAGIEWNEAMGCLVVYDLASEALFLAPFSGADLPSARELVLIGCDADLPNLKGDLVHLGSREGGFWVKHDRLAPVGDYLFKDDAWSFAFQDWNWGAMWRVDRASAEGHEGPLRIIGSGIGFEPPRSCEIRMGGFPLGSSSRAVATQATVDQWMELIAPSEFRDFPGAEFTVVSVAGESTNKSLPFRPLVRYGHPHTTGNSYRLVRGKLAASRLFVGSRSVPVSCQINLSRSAVDSNATAKFDSWLAVAFDWRGSDAPTNVVEVHGEHAFLEPVHVQEFSNCELNGRIGGISTWIDIPKDEQLEGVIVLFQWYLQSKEKPDQLAVSEVIGARIWKSAEGPGPQPRVAPADGHEAARARFRDELNRSVREGSAERFGVVRKEVARQLRAR